MTADETRYYLSLRGDQWYEGVFMARRDGDAWYGAWADVLGVDRPICFGKRLDVCGLRPYVMTHDPEVAGGFLRDAFRQFAGKYLDEAGIMEVPGIEGVGPTFLEAAVLEDSVLVLTAGCGVGLRQTRASLFGPDGLRRQCYDERPELREGLPRIGREEAGDRALSALRSFWNGRLARFGLELDDDVGAMGEGQWRRRGSSRGPWRTAATVAGSRCSSSWPRVPRGMCSCWSWPCPPSRWRSIPKGT